MAMTGTRFLFRTFTLRHLLQNKLRNGLTIIGITLGVAILLAIQLANHTALEKFKQSVELVSGKANLEVVPTAAPTMKESIAVNIQWLWSEQDHSEQGQWVPIIEQTALPGNGERLLIHVLGVDMLSDFQFRPFEFLSGSEPTDPLSIFNQNRIYISQPLAKHLKITVNEKTTLLIDDTVKEVTVAGILKSTGLSQAYSGNLILMDIGNAQSVYGLEGKINRLDLSVPKDKLETIQARLADQLPSSITVQQPKQRGQQIEKMLKAFQLNLMALSFIALLVAMFLIYNTMSISVLRRRHDIGTLRALGVFKRQILALFGLEVLFHGVLGSLLGLGLGIFLAHKAVSGISSTVEILYTGMPVTGIELNTALLWQAFIVGVGLTLVAAIPPVLEAISVQPAEVTRRGSTDTQIATMARWLPLGSLLLWGIAFWAAQQPPVEGFPVFGHLASLFTVLGVALLMPKLLQIILSLLKPLLSLCFKAEGTIAVASLRGALGRTSVAVASLMVAIAMTISLAVMIGSFRETVQLWVHQTIQADLWIEPLWRTVSSNRRLSPDLAEKIKQVSGVELVDQFYEFPVVYNGQPANLATGNFKVLQKRGNLKFLSGEPTQTVIERTLNNNGMLVTEAFAYKHQLKEKDKITLNTPAGEKTFSIEGIYYDYASEHGYMIIDRTLYQQYYNDNSVTGIAVFLEEGIDATAKQQEIMQLTHHTGLINIVTRQGLREEVMRIFEETFSITYALHIISITVAILGIMNALFAMVLESKREFGILKYIGASAKQIQKIVLVEAGLLGLLGNITGVLVGLLLSVLLIYVINKQSFGWTILFTIPWDFIGQTIALIMFAALISGILPARFASKTLAPNVLREE